MLLGPKVMLLSYHGHNILYRILSHVYGLSPHEISLGLLVTATKPTVQHAAAISFFLSLQDRSSMGF